MSKKTKEQKLKKAKKTGRVQSSLTSFDHAIMQNLQVRIDALADQMQAASYSRAPFQAFERGSSVVQLNLPAEEPIYFVG